MIVSFAKQSRATAAGTATFRSLTDYMDRSEVLKKIADVGRVRVRRDPEPEVLLGYGPLFCIAGRTVDFKHKYRAGVISFAPDDVEVARFNRGCPTERHRVDLTIRLFLDLAFAGIPTSSRPPTYMTAHTHLGRLELHFAMLRAVQCPDGRIRSHNPHYPRAQSAHAWQAFTDFLNGRFGWADPLDPGRRRDLIRPDWHEKHAAETRRAKGAPQQDYRSQLHKVIKAGIDSGEITDRSGILHCLQSEIERWAFVIHQTGHRSITIGPAAAKPRDRIRLQGPAFCAQFASRAALQQTGELSRMQCARAEELATARERLQAAIDARAEFNRSHFGRGLWSEPRIAVADYEAEDPTGIPKLIPFRPALLQKPTKRELTNVHDPVRTPGVELDREDRSQLGGGSSRNRGLESRARCAERQSRALAEAARRLHGPVGLAIVIGRLSAGLNALATALTRQLRRAHLAHIIKAPLTDLTEATERLEETISAIVTRTSPRGNAARSERCARPSDACNLEPAGPVAGRRHREGRHASGTLRDDGADRGGSSRPFRGIGGSTGHDVAPAGDRGGLPTDGGGPDAPSPTGRPHRSPARASDRTPRGALVTDRLIDHILRISEALQPEVPAGNIRFKRIRSGLRVFAQDVVFDIFPDSVNVVREGADPQRLRRMTDRLGRSLALEPAANLEFEAPSEPTSDCEQGPS